MEDDKKWELSNCVIIYSFQMLKGKSLEQITCAILNESMLYTKDIHMVPWILIFAIYAFFLDNIR